ncbi:MAG: response regulator transcription factor [Firmicutes bacterium]|nr:response regulator transcription factor [Bacillota bacterium]
MSLEERSILIVDDEEEIVNVLEAYLQKDEYKVFKAFNGKKALKIFDEEDIDLIVLDLMLPDLSGEAVCKKVRLKSQVPILMLTAKVEEDDRITGLDIGADDYITKPFSPRELMARIRAIFRRISDDRIKANILEFNKGKLVIDKVKKEVVKNGETVEVTPTELKILLLLGSNVGRTFSREDLVQKILGYDYEGFDRTIDTHIKNLRNKIEDNNSKYIKTVYGLGYKFIGGQNDK